MNRGEIIYALASGPPPSGISVFRISGPHLEDLVFALLRKTPQPRIATLGPIYKLDQDHIIDYGLVLWFPSPKSFTGEDCLELHLHGSRAVQLALIETLSHWPQCRLAEPGEFTLRALKNGKMNVMEVEAMADLLQADTEAQRFQAIGAFNGSAIDLINSWREQLIKALSLIEASLDFSDEGDISPHLLEQFFQIIDSVLASLRQASEKIERAEIIRDGFRVAIIGPPNAGKSSLLNHIAGRDVAIVSEYAGTTRDIIEVKLGLGGVPIVFSDTAGLRDTDDPVEKIGIERTYGQINQAQFILYLNDKNEFSNVFASPKTGSIRVRSKIDINLEVQECDFAISSKTGEGISALLNHIKSQAKELINPYEASLFFNQRQNIHIQNAIEALLRVKELNLIDQTEFIAEDLRIALQSLASLIGKVDAEDILGYIFSSFCIGK